MKTQFRAQSKFSTGHLSIPELVDVHGKQGFHYLAVTEIASHPASLRGFYESLLQKSIRPAHFPIYSAIMATETQRAFAAYGMTLVSGLEFAIGTFKKPRSLVAFSVTGYIDPRQSGDLLRAEILGQGGSYLEVLPREEIRFAAWQKAAARRSA